jgi:hypothetical protein
MRESTLFRFQGLLNHYDESHDEAFYASIFILSVEFPIRNTSLPFGFLKVGQALIYIAVLCWRHVYKYVFLIETFRMRLRYTVKGESKGMWQDYQTFMKGIYKS